MFRTFLTAALPAIALVAAPASAQLSGSVATGSTGGLSGSLGSGSSSAVGNSGLNSTAIGRAPAPLGTNRSLTDRIDSAAGLSPSLRPGGAATLDRSSSRSGIGAGTIGNFGPTNRIEDSLRPTGRPLGSSVGTPVTQGTQSGDAFVPR